MKIIISPWRSATPRTLSKFLGARLVKLEDVGRVHAKAIINWGCSGLHGATATQVINDPHCVQLAANKLFCLNTMKADKIPTLEYTKKREEALEWNQKSSIIAHIDVHGHSGSGLKRLEPKTALAEFPYCDLYTKYFAKDKELRVLCIRHGDTFDTMFLEKKRILPERYAEFGLAGKPDWFIRTHANGWIFSREAEVLPGTTELAKRAMHAIGLHFGAVDILAKPMGGAGGTAWDCRVGEVNTAPGLEGQTLEFFKSGLFRLLRNAA